MILTGAAGTGKTAATTWIVELAEREGYSIQLLASTNTAKVNITKKVFRPASTIHSYIYEIITENGREVCHRKEITPRETKCLYIIDEASLIPGKKAMGSWQTPKSILEDLVDHCQKECPTGKMLFIGDPNQLPPVNEQRSLALCPNALKIILGKDKEVLAVHLRQVMRQDTHSIVYGAAQSCLHAIQNNASYKNPEQLEVLRNAAEVASNISTSVDSENIDLTQVGLAPSNRQVSWLNTQIRRELGRPDGRLHKGDHLVVDETIFHSHGKISRGTDTLVIESKEKLIEWGSVQFQEVKIKYSNGDESLPIWTLINLDYCFAETTSLPEDVEKRLVATAMATNPRYRNTRDKRDEKYLSAARVRPRYAMTVHKSQGREFQNVYIIPDWFKFPMHTPKYKHQYMYTAVTRAIENAYLFNLYLPKSA